MKARATSSAREIENDSAIDAARAYFRTENPLKERFMSRLFGLDTPLPRSQPTRARMIRLSLELSVSESTLYKWREDILEIVLYAAIEAGLAGLFGLRTSAPEDGAYTEGETHD